MRLSPDEVSAIKSAIAERDSNARIYLFGSRVDDAKRGGDIDLLIMSEILSAEDRGQIRWDLCGKLGEQKIDILIAKDTSDPFVSIAFKAGEKL